VSVTVVSCLYGERIYQRFALAWRHSLRTLERQPDAMIVAGDWHARIPPSATSVVSLCPWRHPQAYYLQQAITAAETDWVWILDIDDLALPDALNGIDDVKADVWMMGYERSDGEAYVPPPLEAMDVLGASTSPIPAGSAIRTEAFHDCGGFYDVAFQDWALWRSLAKDGATFESSGRANYRYNRHPATRSEVELSPSLREAHLPRCSKPRMKPLRLDEVSAVIVTRGNTDLTTVLDSLIFNDRIVWDNSREPVDEMTYGRALAIGRAKNPIIYSQDDDIIHTAENQARIVAEYQPGVLTGCMWPEWSDGARAQGIQDGYDDLVFAGSGSVYDAHVPAIAAARYLEQYPYDDFFLLWADTIIGVLAPNRQLDIRFDALPCAEDADRMCNLPDGTAMKTEAIRRAR
jgi:hypothetical protein